MGPCSGGDVVAFFCMYPIHFHRFVIAGSLLSGFMPSESTNHHKEGFEFKEVPVEEILQGNCGELDPECANVIKHSVDRMPWRLYLHQPYEHWHKGKACILGDAAHPMLVSYTHPFFARMVFSNSVANSRIKPKGPVRPSRTLLHSASSFPTSIASLAT
jgi:hypothetical protein